MMINFLFNLVIFTIFSSTLDRETEVRQDVKATSVRGTEQTAEDSIVVEKSVAYDGQKISLDFKFGQLIKINGWGKNEVKIIATRKSLLNHFELVVNKDEHTIAASVDWDEVLRETEECRCQTERGTSNRNCLVFNFEVWLPEKSAIDVNTISANMELAKLHGPVQAKNISGFIDFTAPSKTGVTFTAKSITGEIYADSTFKLNNDEIFEHHFASNVQGSFEGGGNEVILSTISSNIYLRRSVN